jgi:S-methylmethionine-dependent homocysteine/selenocysteine methylase
MSNPSTKNLPLRMDGGVATELQRAGLPMSPPWWTTRALLTEQQRRILRDVHERYLASGAQVITANTFRCNLRALQAAGLEAAGLAWMVHAAVGVALAARNEAGDARTWIAGSMAPVEDCYWPDLVPSDDELRAEHRWLATELLRAGVDLILIETMNCLREARIALEQVLATGGRAWVSFVCTDGARLLSGERLADAARAMEGGGADAVLVNCTPLAQTEECLRALRGTCSGPIGAYPNLEDRTGIPRWTHVDGSLPASMEPDEFAHHLLRWHDEFGVTMLGGCCGTAPPHIAALRDQLGSAHRTEVHAADIAT